MKNYQFFLKHEFCRPLDSAVRNDRTSRPTCTYIHTYRPTRRHITEDCNLNIHRPETLVSDPQDNLGK